jgi:hypothetical protein
MTAAIVVLICWLLIAVLLGSFLGRLFRNAGKVELQQRRFYDGKWYGR